MDGRHHVAITKRASRDIDAIHAYVSRDSPQGAATVIAALLDAIDSLELLPHRYPVCAGRRRPADAVRRMPVPPYLVYYRVRESASAVEVIRVLHGARRQPRRFT